MCVLKILLNNYVGNLGQLVNRQIHSLSEVACRTVCHSDDSTMVLGDLHRPNNGGDDSPRRVLNFCHGY